MKKIFVFDCDQTIWTNSNDDYLSSLFSPLVLASENALKRTIDESLFFLKPKIKQTFKLIKNKGYVLGIVSDNNKSMIIEALKLFKLIEYINPNAINATLWKGYCPKHKMIIKILKKPEFIKIPVKNVYWFDDKDYTKEAQLIGLNFIKVSKKTNILKIVKNII